jgi:hypothetical protein
VSAFDDNLMFAVNPLTTKLTLSLSNWYFLQPSDSFLEVELRIRPLFQQAIDNVVVWVNSTATPTLDGQYFLKRIHFQYSTAQHSWEVTLGLLNVAIIDDQLTTQNVTFEVGYETVLLRFPSFNNTLVYNPG